MDEVKGGCSRFMAGQPFFVMALNGFELARRGFGGVWREALSSRSLRVVAAAVLAGIGGEASGQVSRETVLVARTSATAPGAALSLVEGAGLSASGQIAVAAVVRASNGQDAGHAILAGPSGALAMAIREGVTRVPLLFGEGVLREDFALRLRGFNARGDILFSGVAEAVGGGGQATAGLWLRTSEGIRLVYSPGMVAPGTGGAIFGQTEHGYPPLLNDRGEVALLGSAAEKSGIWVGAPGSLRLLAWVGQPFPGGGPGETIQRLGPPALNDRGEAAFVAVSTAQTSGGGAVEAVVAGRPGALRVVARSGDPAPGLPSGLFIGSMGDAAAPAINNSGEVVFSASTPSDQPELLRDYIGVAIYLAGPRGLELVARTGAVAPGGQQAWDSLERPQLSDAGTVAFAGSLRAPGPTSGLWAGPVGALRRLVAEGEPVPGGEGAVFWAFDTLYLSGRGQVAIVGLLMQPGGEITRGLFATDHAGAVQQVARQGEAVGALPPLLRLNGRTEFWSDSTTSVRAFDGEGRLVFSADHMDPSTHEGIEVVHLAAFPARSPVIVEPPQEVAGVPGGAVVLRVGAAGSGQLTYQWKKNGVSIPGATGAVLHLDSAGVGALGAYTVSVSNGLGSVSSQAVHVSLPPVIGVPPADAAAVSGESATFVVAARGLEPLAYQWLFQQRGAAGYSEVPGATAPELVLRGVTSAQEGRYAVRVSSPGGVSVSGGATLSVSPAGRPLVEKLALSGEPLPLAPGLQFGAVGPPLINNRGQVTFPTSVRSASGDPRGALRLLVSGQRFEILQGFGDYPLNGDINLSDAGIVVAGSNLITYDNKDNNGLIWGGPGELQVLLQESAPVPGENPPVAKFAGINAFSVNSHGVVAARDAGFDPTGVFSGTPGALTPVAFPNRAAPGAEAGTEFWWMGAPSIDDAGRICFVAGLQGPAVTPETDTGIWCQRAGVLSMVLRAGAPAPGASGATVGAVQEVRTNSRGDLLVSAELRGGSGGTGLWTGQPGALQLIARTGQVVQGHTLEALPVSRGLLPPLLGGGGQVLFYARVSGGGASSGTSIWLWTPGAGGGTYRLLARHGMPAPGTGVAFGAVDGAYLGSAEINRSGQVALHAHLAGAGITEQNDEALWLVSQDGVAHLLAQEGRPFALADGEMRVVASIMSLNFQTTTQLSGGEDGLPRSLSAQGELAFALGFEDGTSGVFRAILRPPHPFPSWAAGRGLSGAAAAPEADPDNDGQENFLEWALGRDPRASDARTEAEVRREGDRMVAEFIRRRDTRRLEYSFELLSGRPATWRPLPAGWRMRTLPLDGAFERVILQRQANPQEAPEVVRMRVRFQ